MTSIQLASLAGVILSLAFSYIPGLNTWFGKQSTDIKRVITAVCILIVAIGAFGLSCVDVVNVVACSKQGAIDLISAVIAALVSNQTTYVLTKS